MVATDTKTTPSTDSVTNNGTAARFEQPGGTGRSAGTSLSAGATGAEAPAGDRGRTSIADVVVVKIAGMAAREIPGVHDMGGGLSRTLGAVRDRVPGGRPNVGRGVKVEVGERQTAIDLELVVEYGVSIKELASEVRENVILAVERITGLEVVEVNIAIDDVRLPDDEDSSASGGEQTRVA
ncbi:Asp23/Gls24 family envelope stress response protein [Streptomyces sp. MBT56]|uniref:Asp23/Gls24 family envelope stress response protein n=1 Tax=unclassified Streptomyces TaxID=2593676 RepID=UPI00190CC810|nr:Asp23/Gls24 family envelope stress response protein [Streptomyces sp. MBT56]MBK3606950.1 Asp23/Gls24 family envelope stress response protein [Streptomyces sp. MBT54]MBK3619478.1 Asp23/Gls24 family envelope stress response protein [Streptomyces sp. MBT98]MBK6047003.1 Asp23/Gls24 family envelope stress response protein [Streptomyces sp. MBT55]